jgi:hypothetical protein
MTCIQNHFVDDSSIEGGIVVPDAVDEIVWHAFNQIRGHLFNPPEDPKTVRYLVLSCIWTTAPLITLFSGLHHV